MAGINSNALVIPSGIANGIESIVGLTFMTIKASPEAMEAKAQEVRSAAAQIRQEFEELSRAVSRTAGYWNGEAAELHRKRYEDMKPRAQDMFQCLEEHAGNLQEIAALYTATQAKVTTMTQALPKDAIE